MKEDIKSVEETLRYTILEIFRIIAGKHEAETVYVWVKAIDELPEHLIDIYFTVGGVMDYGYYNKPRNKFYSGRWKEHKENIEDIEWLKEVPLSSIKHLPSIDQAGAVAVSISENVKPELTVQEQAFFIAGFQECIKWLSSIKQKDNVEGSIVDEFLRMYDSGWKRRFV